MWLNLKQLIDKVKNRSIMKAEKDKLSNEDEAMVVLKFGYAHYVLPADKALTVLIAMNNAQLYEKHTDYKSNSVTHHVWEESGIGSVETISRELYLCAKLAGKRESN